MLQVHYICRLQSHGHRISLTCVSHVEEQHFWPDLTLVLVSQADGKVQ